MGDFEERSEKAKRDPRREWMEAWTREFNDGRRDWTWAPVTEPRPVSEFMAVLLSRSAALRLNREAMERRIGDPFEDGA